jgi:hypothetical protein
MAQEIKIIEKQYDRIKLIQYINEDREFEEAYTQFEEWDYFTILSRKDDKLIVACWDKGDENKIVYWARYE